MAYQLQLINLKPCTPLFTLMVALVLPLSSIINYDKDKPIQLVYNEDNSDVVMGEQGLGQRTRFHLPRVRINTSSECLSTRGYQFTVLINSWLIVGKLGKVCGFVSVQSTLYMLACDTSWCASVTYYIGVCHESVCLSG